MDNPNYLTTLAKRLRPLMKFAAQEVVGANPPGEGPGIDIVGNIVGLGGDSVLLYDDGGLPVAEFATIALALAAAAPGNVVIIPAGVFTENVTIPADVSLISTGNKSTILGTVTLGGDKSLLIGVTIILAGSDAGDLVGVIGPSTGTGSLFDVWIIVTNSGSGNAYAVQGDVGDLRVRDGYCSATASGGGDAIGVYNPSDGTIQSNNNYVYGWAVGGGDGYDFKVDGAGDIYATDGLVQATTAPVG